MKTLSVECDSMISATLMRKFLAGIGIETDSEFYYREQYTNSFFTYIRLKLTPLRGMCTTRSTAIDVPHHELDENENCTIEVPGLFKIDITSDKFEIVFEQPSARMVLGILRWSVYSGWNGLDILCIDGRMIKSMHAFSALALAIAKGITYEESYLLHVRDLQQAATHKDID